MSAKTEPHVQALIFLDTGMITRVQPQSSLFNPLKKSIRSFFQKLINLSDWQSVILEEKKKVRYT